jgi:WD40 repeat protein
MPVRSWVACVEIVAAFVVARSIAHAAESSQSHVLWSTDWSHDDRLFSVSGERVLRIYDAKTLEQLPAPPALPFTSRAAWHPGKNRLAITGWGGEGAGPGIYDLDTNEHLKFPATEAARDIAWHPAGDRLGTAGTEGSLQIWTAGGKLLHTTRPPASKGLTGVAWSPDGDRLVTVGEYVQLYDAEGRLLARSRRQSNGERGRVLLLCVAWHPSGEFFVVGDYGQRETGDPPNLTWYSAVGEPIRSIPREAGAEVRNLSWNPDGSRLASASDVLGIWTKDGELESSTESPSPLWGVRWSHDGRQILTSSYDGEVVLWDVEGNAVKQFRIPSISAATKSE